VGVVGAAAAAAAAPGRARARQHRRYAALSLSPLCSPCLVPELLRLPLGAGRWGCFRELCPASTGPNSNGGRGFTPVLSTAEPQCRFRGLVGCHFWPSRAGGRAGTSRFCVVRSNKVRIYSAPDSGVWQLAEPNKFVLPSAPNLCLFCSLMRPLRVCVFCC
jgi:hypothetical protein